MSDATREARPGRVPAAAHTLVKVCGITRAEDARAALEAGADLLGFVLADSPRGVAPQRASEILAAVPGARGVAVLVRPTPDDALGLARGMGAERVQLHGVDAARWPADFPLPVIFAVGIQGGLRRLPAWPDPRHWMLCDAAREGLWGGSGESFDWSLVAGLARRCPVVLAGGLSADNVEAALSRVRPLGVDASSRLERSPGIKDHGRVRDFVAAVRRFDAQAGPAA